MPPDSEINSERMDTIIGNLLRTGVGLAAALVFIGGLIYLFRHGAETPGYAVFRGEPADLRTLTGILHDVQSLRGRGIIQLGLLVLIATPIARVAFLAYIFTRQRDMLYTAVALIVLALLAYSLFGQ